MPAVIVHDSFALEFIPEEEKKYQAAVRAGTQGPDFFMAYGTNPLKKRADSDIIRPFGSHMHQISIFPTYWKLLQYAAEKEGEEKELLFAYIDGLLMHFSVDRSFHPYIFYRSGFDENGELHGKWGWAHGYFEAILDKVVGTKKGTFQRPDKAMGQMDIESAKLISKMWHACADYPLKDDSFTLSYIDYNAVTKMMWSPHGGKRALISLFGKYSKPMAMIYPSSKAVKKYEYLDVMNEKHSLWKDPATLEESTESFDELWLKAKEAYESVHELLLRAKKGEDVGKELEIWSLNRNHDGTPIGGKKKEHGDCFNLR